MFLSVEALVFDYGIDKDIARFYVDREPPENNLYWKGKELYLRPQPGYIFLPSITDLYYRSGISKEILLSENFVQTLEQIGHYAAEEEVGIISKNEAVKKAAELVTGSANDVSLFAALQDYLNKNENFISALTTPFPALHRGDYFLFVLALLDIDFNKQVELIKTWFALITTLLLMDDAEDFEEDQLNKHENAFIESGADKAGFEKLKVLLSSNLKYLAAINTTLEKKLHSNFIRMAEKPFIREYLNA